MDLIDVAQILIDLFFPLVVRSRRGMTELFGKGQIAPIYYAQYVKT